MSKILIQLHGGSLKKDLSPLIVLFFVLTSSCSYSRSDKEVPSINLYTDEIHSVPGRGIISTFKDRDDIFLCWRLLPEDPDDVSFNIYRKEIGDRDENYKWTAQTDRTFYLDRGLNGKKYAYAVRPIHGGKEGNLSRESIPLSSINGKAALIFDVGHPYKQARVVTGDLNGDGEPEIVVAYSSYQNVDPYVTAWSKSEDTIKVAAFLPTGERLWELDLGWGIEAGMDYQPMVVWDLDGDGRAEVILKTNKSADPLDYSGERITVLDGISGKIRQETKWPPPPWSPGRRISRNLSGIEKGIWSDYNNDSRNYLAIAHLDGKDPYIIAARGTYKSQRIWALDMNLNRVWERNLGLDHYFSEGFPNVSLSYWDRLNKFWNMSNKVKHLVARFTKELKLDQYRGSHCMPIADIDDDGKEEIFWGERCIGENGEDLWAITEKIPYPGHPDIVFPADIHPSRKGKEIYYAREGGVGKSEKIGVYLADHKGNVIWAKWGYHHIDRGWASNIIADRYGMQCFGFDIEDKHESKEGPWDLIKPLGLLWNAEGILLGNPPASWYYSIPADWDGDGIREIVVLNDGKIYKYGGPVLETLSAECLWGADLFGDHREEIVAAPMDGKIYIFFNTDIILSYPRMTRMADRQYKNDLSRTAMQATVIPTEGGFVPKRLK